MRKSHNRRWAGLQMMRVKTKEMYQRKVIKVESRK
jgi:hypothetical protein